MGFRARVCSECQPVPRPADHPVLPTVRSCEVCCPLFIQLPRLARFLERHRAKPPTGYEEFVIKLLCESSEETPKNDRHLSDHGAEPGPFLDYATDALAILERVAALFDKAEIATPGHDCARRDIALGQMSVLASKADAGQPSLEKP
jgi:hypothetical protein